MLGSCCWKETRTLRKKYTNKNTAKNPTKQLWGTPPHIQITEMEALRDGHKPSWCEIQAISNST